MANLSSLVTLFLITNMILCLQAALYKPNMVGIQRDVPPEIGGPISQPSSQQGNNPPFSSEPQQGLNSASRGPGGTFPAEEPKRLNVPDGGSIRYSKDPPQTDSGYNGGLARSAPLAPPGGRVKPYVGDGYVGGSSQREPNSNLPPSYPGRDSPNEIIPEGYGSSQNAAAEPKYQIPKKPPAVPQSSYSNKPNPFTEPRPAQTNPFSLDTFSASSPAGPNNKQRNNNGPYPPQGQGYPQQNSYPSSQQIQPQQSKNNLQPYGPARPSEKRRNPSNEDQFNIPGDFSPKLDNAGPPPPGTNKVRGPGNTLTGTPAFPAPFGFPESLKVGQNSPFKNLVSFNSPRPFKSRSSLPFPDKGGIFGGFSNSNYETPAAPAAAAAPESRPAKVAANQPNQPAYRIDYPEARESQNSYSPTSRGSNPAYPPQDGGAYNTRQTGPYFPPQSSSNLGYGFPVQNGELYGNPYGYSNPPNGQCFRYTYAAEGYRLSDIGKNYPQ